MPDLGEFGLRARVAIIGAGTAGQRHISAIRHSGKVELAGVVETNADIVATLRRNGIACAATLDQLLHSVDLDGIVVATPTDCHLQPVLKSLEAGLSVLVEKPVSSTVADATKIDSAAKAAGKPVLVGHQRRFQPLVMNARKIIRSGALGRIVMIAGLWGVRKPAEYYSEAWRNERAAGPVLINLTHEIDLLRYLFGDIASVQAFAENLIEHTEKEDAAAIALRFQSGVLGTFAASDRVISPWGWEFATGENVICPSSGQNYLHIAGTEGSLEFPNLAIWKQNKRNGDWTQTINRFDLDFDYVDSYVHQIEHFAEVALGHQSPRISVQDATRTLETALALLAAADSGASQTVSTTL